MIFLYNIMDIKKYIASGILEDYILGLVSDEERQEVERYVQQYPAIQQEVNAIEEALGQFALSQAKPMPKGLDTQILAHINNLATTDPPSSDNTNTPSSREEETKPNTSTDTSNNGGGWIKGLLGLLTFLGLSAAAFFYQKSNTLSTESNQLQSNVSSLNQQLVDQQLVCDNTKKQLEEQLAVLRNESYRSILMKGTDKAPDALAAIYYNEADNKTYLDVRNMPAPTTDKQYQLWAIVDGAPVDMGVFDLPIDSVDFVEVPHIANAQAFAVTLETKGGNPTPNLEEMYVIGNT